VSVENTALSRRNFAPDFDEHGIGTSNDKLGTTEGGG
jgi:hypothetical protein